MCFEHKIHCLKYLVIRGVLVLFNLFIFDDFDDSFGRLEKVSRF